MPGGLVYALASSGAFGHPSISDLSGNERLRVKPASVSPARRVTDPDLLRQAYKTAVQRTLPGTAIYVALFATVVLSTSYQERFPRLTVVTGALLVAIGLWRLTMIMSFGRWYSWHPRSWRILFSLAAVSVGAVWSGFWVFAMLSDGLVPATNLALMATVGIASAGVSTLAPSRTVMTTFLILMMLPLAVVTPLGGTPEHYAIAFMLVAGLLFLLSIGRRLHGEYWTDLYHKQLVNERASELTVARDAAVKADKAKSEFLARMSHEVRTPMNGVMGMLELLQTTPLTPRQQSFANNIGASADVLLKIIDEVLDFSKIEAHRLRLEEVDFDLEEAVEESANLLAQHAREKGIEVLTDIPAGMVTGLRGDPLRFRQVLTNLLSNAVKFTEAGEIVVRAEQVAETARDSLIRIEVADTGIGIHQDQHREIFKAFSQADTTTAREYGGTGLGLAIVKQLAELMGGHVGINSEPGRGSRFWFTARLTKRTLHESPPLANSKELAGLRVLVIDDNAASRCILMSQLQAWEMKPVAAESGSQALEILSAASAEDPGFDMIVVDRDMPEMSGASLVRHLRDSGPYARTPTVMLSPLGNTVCCPDAIELGIAGCVTKPVRRKRLFAEMLEAANEHHYDPLRERDGDEPDKPVGSPLNLRVLVAEDNLVNQIIAEEMLQIIGCDSKLVATGREAMEALHAADFDAVLMDCRMPEMDGYEATAAIRRREKEAGREQHLPIIALTAQAGDGARDRAIAAGMDEYLCKPFEMSALRDVLQRCVPGKHT